MGKLESCRNTSLQDSHIFMLCETFKVILVQTNFCQIQLLNIKLTALYS